MIALDTNVLVRVLVDDDDSPEQNQQARALVQEAGKVWISQIVQVKFVWVLDQAYGLEKPEILNALQILLDNPIYELQAVNHFVQVLERFRNSNAGFADALIAVESANYGTILWTFDRKLSQQNQVVRLNAESLANF